MNPKKISFFIVSVLLVLFGITFLSGLHQTEKGTVNEGFNIKVALIKYPTTSLLLSKKADKNDKVASIINETHIISNDTEEKNDESQEKRDSLIFAKTDKKETLKTNTEGRIYYPDSIVGFITKLKQKLKASRCQIIHYGDSQIEGDRITSYTRNRLQGLFGGGGPGFFPIKVAYEQNSIDITSSPNWLRYAAFDRKQKYLNHAKYGIYGSLSRFTPHLNTITDSAKVALMPTEKATFTIKPSKKAFQRLQKFHKMGIHYGNNHTPTFITVYENGNVLMRDSLKTDGRHHLFQIDFQSTPQEIKVELEGKISPDFYGITLDDITGVRMDNVAMRGESGRFFIKMNQENFRQMANQRKADIIIFQYGGNTIPYINEEKQVGGYVRTLMRNIKWVKDSNPEALCLLIGPGDMATSVNGEMVTYPFLPLLNDEMKKQSLQNGMAYWSLFEAMGGENSMVSWVEKGYASPDYIHFRPEGTRLMAELLVQCLQEDLLTID